MIKTLTAVLILTSQIATAEIYQWTDKEGHVHYSESLPKDIQSAKNIKQRNESNLPGITQMDQQQLYEPLPNNDTNNGGQANNDASWNQCAETKREAVIAEKNRASNAAQLNEWLWKNCKQYSNELRTVEQQMM